MKTTITHWIFPAVLVSLLFVSCKKDKDEAPQKSPDTGQVTMTFTHVFGSAALPFSLNQQFVHPKTGDTLTYTTLKYYVTRIRLQRDNGNWFSQPASYHLMDLNGTNSLSLVLNDIPAGTYTTLEYTLGVDSATHASGMQTGDLDPLKGMYWDMNKGYIMIKAEGSSPQAAGGVFSFHLGGYTGTNSIVAVKTVPLGSQSIAVGSGKQPRLNIQVNAGRFWHTMAGVGTNPIIQEPGALAKEAADGFHSGLTLKSVVQ